MARILSVSFHERLLKSRELILTNVGHEVTSALGFNEALSWCQSAETFDVFILGHSIPHHSKVSLVSAFRTHHPAPVIALKRWGEPGVGGADFEIEPSPEELITVVAQITGGGSGKHK